MNTFHLSLDVPDLDGAVAFYRQLFGVEPAKLKPNYAKFELTDPPVALALQENGHPGLSHLGIRVDSTREVEQASTRLRDSGLVTLDQRDTTCCYARQDKIWVHDPDGTPWEVFATHEDSEKFGDATGAETAGAGSARACC